MRRAILLPLAVFTGLLLVSILSGLTGSTLHRESSRWLVVVMWASIPLSVLLPLVLRWAVIRRKVLAIGALVVAGLLVGVSILADSFTGYLILRMQEPEQHLGTLLRMKALHRIGFPIFLILGVTMLWTISIVLARRPDQPASAAIPER